ncbi:MAG: hypothetical protein FJW26_19250 [Acidimicrobiia bacterium]|nr:hypothetical protein [Acidimicrobiia bacterium]
MKPLHDVRDERHAIGLLASQRYVNSVFAGHRRHGDLEKELWQGLDRWGNNGEPANATAVAFVARRWRPALPSCMNQQQDGRTPRSQWN